jgi:hypothetical protein
VRFQLEGQIFAQIEDWRRSQLKIPSRPEAIRELLKRALSIAKRPAVRAEHNRRSASSNRDAV